MRTYLAVLGCWALWGLFNASRLRFVAELKGVPRRERKSRVDSALGRCWLEERADQPGLARHGDAAQVVAAPLDLPGVDGCADRHLRARELAQDVPTLAGPTLRVTS